MYRESTNLSLDQHGVECTDDNFKNFFPNKFISSLMYVCLWNFIEGK